MDAVVMAAGQGTRLRPLTEEYAKPVLPIDGRPVIATLLHELATAAVGRAWVVTGHLAGQVEALLAGGGFGVDVRFVRQPRADGSGDAVARAVAAGAAPPFLVTAADTAYSPGDVARFARAVERAGAAGAIAVREGYVPSVGKPGVRIADGRVERMVDYDTALPLTSAPLWALGPELAPYLAGLPGPPFELREAYQRGIADGLTVAAIEIGATRDITDPVDLAVHNFPYLRGLPPS